MKFVIDTNILMSAIIKNSLTRKIIFDKKFEFITPSYTLSEIDKYKEELCKKSKLNLDDLNGLLDILFDYIKIINRSVYESNIEEMRNLIVDPDDIPFLACAMALNANIWSDDKHFKKQKKIKIFTTNDFIKKFLKSNAVK